MMIERECYIKEKETQRLWLSPMMRERQTKGGGERAKREREEKTEEKNKKEKNAKHKKMSLSINILLLIRA